MIIRPFFYFFVLQIFSQQVLSEDEIKIKIKIIRTIFQLN